MRKSKSWPVTMLALLVVLSIASYLIACAGSTTAQCISGDTECSEGAYKVVCPGTDCTSSGSYASCTPKIATVMCQEYTGDWHPIEVPHCTWHNPGGIEGTCVEAELCGECPE